MTDSSQFRTGFIAIVGRPNVGKSTLLNHLVGQKISITSRKAQTTRHRITGVLTGTDTQYIFVDTPGFQLRHKSALNRLMNRTVTQTLADVDVILFVIEAGKFTDSDRKVLDLLPKERPVILVVNKTDTVSDRGQLLPLIERVASSFDFAAVVPVSAKLSAQLPELLSEIRSRLPESDPLFDEDAITDRNERFLAAELIREKLFRLLGDEIPYSTSVVVDQFELDGALRRIQATIIVDKAGQKSIVIGKGGEKLKVVATQARTDMEKLFEGKVFLQIWVKVKGGWAEDERTLRRLGYDS